MPKALFTDNRYKSLSDSAKILYGLMLDRMGLSLKNDWLDSENRVYIYFTLEDVQEYINCKHEKAVKLLAELDTVKGVGLIERKKQGQGKPTIIYVKNFTSTAEVEISDKQKFSQSVPQISSPLKNRSHDVRETEGNKTYSNKTEYSNTEYQSIYPSADIPELPKTNGIDKMDSITATDIYRDIIKDNIEYDTLCQCHDPERIDEILELISETVCSPRKTIRIGGEDSPVEVVKSRFMKLGQFHVEYVLDCLGKNTTKIRNIRSYLLTTLYNAPATINHYYAA